MRVYYPGERKNHLLYVAPAADPRSNKGAVDSSWVGADGAAITFEVCFRNGAADVPDPLGRYLCATGQAKRTRLIIPELRVA